MKTILVTGAAGFIGSHFCEALLRQGMNVVGVDNMNAFYDPDVKKQNHLIIEQTASTHHSEFSFYETDIRQSFAMRSIFMEHKIDAVVHLAAMAGVRPSFENPLLYEEINQGGTTALLEEMRRAGIKKFVFASSSSVYGNNQKIPFSESDSVDDPISIYAATKRAGELTCRVYHQIYGMSVAALRFFTVYGPRQRPDLAIHKFTHLILSGKKIPVYGDGSKKRDFTYIDDIIDGVNRALQWIDRATTPQYEIFNLGESETSSVNDLIQAIEKASGVKAERDVLADIPGDVHTTYADITKAKRVLGYNPQIKLTDGIPKFVTWFRKSKNL